MNETTTVALAPQNAPLPTLDEGKAIMERIEKMSVAEIEARRSAILERAKTLPNTYHDLDTIELHELACIARKLRKTSVGPPKEAKAPRAKSSPKTIDDLM